MIKTKLFISITVFVIFLAITSVIKKLEFWKKIAKLNTKIFIKSKILMKLN